MKKILYVVALVATVWIQPVFAQTSETKNLLNFYFDVKNALVNSDATIAATKAAEFSRALSSIDPESLQGNQKSAFIGMKDKLASDAKSISETKDISQQRDYFAIFSTNVFNLSKRVKLIREPVYLDYCPMKKSYWLSDDPVIKNPYFGKQMLTCGTLKETLK